jgi:hypothetical protein
MAYSDEENVYEACGMNSSVVQSLSGKNSSEVTTLITEYISEADLKIKRLLKIPITIRKEYHKFDWDETVELGPYEDKEEFFSSYDPENCVEEIFALYDDSGRVKLPYPKNCDDLTEDVTDMTGTNATLSKETTIVKCGMASIKAVFSAAGSFYFPKNANLEKNIYPWDYVGFWFRTSDKTATFTIKFYDIDGNVEYQTFALTQNDTWQIVALQMSDNTGSIDWSDALCQKIEILSDKACTIYFDNFCFNDGYFWTYPEGLICWCEPDSDPDGEIEVTYSYDPFKVNVPVDIKLASSKLAGALLIDYLIGHRQQITGFEQMAETMDTRPDRETLEVVRTRLRREAYEALAGFGFGTYR